MFQHQNEKKILKLVSIESMSSINEDDNLRQRLVKRLKYWAMISKIHGIDRVVLSESLFLKLLWLFSFLGLLCVTIYLVANTVTQYYKYEVKSRTREIFQPSIQFPTVTICNINPMATPAAKRYIQDYLSEKFNVNVETYQDLTDQIKSGVIPKNELKYLMYSLNEESFNRELRRSFGYEPLECYFFDTPCSFDHDLEWIFSAEYGNCILFNPHQFKNGTLRQVYHTDIPYSGFELTMFLGLPDDRKNYLYESDTTGLVVKVNNPKKVEMKSINAFVSPGNMALLFASLTTTEMQPQPYSDCQLVDSIDTPVSQRMEHMGVQYSTINCYLVCQQMIVAQKWGCQLLNLPKAYDANNVPMCTNRTAFEKIQRLPRTLFAPCLDWCPNECTKERYDLTMSSLEYPSYTQYYNLVNSNPSFFQKYFNTTNITYETFRASVAKVFLTFKDIKYTHIVETPSYTLYDLISNLGGIMGLFIGVSFMIFVEFIELCLELLLVVFKMRPQLILNRPRQ